MTNTQKAPEQRTAHRRGPRLNVPRDATVCCLVTKDERDTIDELSLEFGLTRSAYIAELVIGLVDAATLEGEEYTSARKKLEDFIGESRQKFVASRPSQETHTNRVTVIKR